MTPQAVLSQPLTLLNGVVIKNRLFKSAMSEALARRDGAAPPELAHLYGVWAQGGVGLCVTGNVMIDRRAIGEPGNVVIEDDTHLEQLKAWAKAATQHGTQCWVQLNHPGKQAPKGLNKQNVAPSAVPFRPEMQAFFPTPRELLDREVRELIQRFATAASVVKRAGFTGVQIHGAHGYLVSQFLSPHHNRRTDDWGGTPEKRRRFVLEVVKAMREQVGAQFPIGIKLNSADFQRGGFTEEESLDTIRALADAGIDLVEISGGTYEAPAMTGVKAKPAAVKDSTRLREAYFLEFAEKARLAVKVPLVVTGGFRTAAAIEPDVCNRLLNGQAPLHPVKPLKTGLKFIDSKGMMEVTWYTGQLQRIGQGQAPRPDESALWVFVKFVAKQAGLGRRKQPTKLRAS